MIKYFNNFNNFLNENINEILESESKNIFKEFGLNWFVFDNYLPTENSYIFLNPDKSYKTLIFDFGLEYTTLKKEDENNIEYYYKKVKNIILKYNMKILLDVKRYKSFYVEVILNGEENITDIIKNYNKIYHVTLDKYLPNIMKNGLKPIIKSPDIKNLTYNYNKIHLTTNINNHYMKDILNNIMNQKNYNGKSIILEIDNSNLKNKFYLDKDLWQSPEFEIYNFWSNSTIPRDKIKIIGDFKNQ